MPKWQSSTYNCRLTESRNNEFLMVRNPGYYILYWKYLTGSYNVWMTLQLPPTYTIQATWSPSCWHKEIAPPTSPPPPPGGLPKSTLHHGWSQLCWKSLRPVDLKYRCPTPFTELVNQCLDYAASYCRWGLYGAVPFKFPPYTTKRWEEALNQSLLVDVFIFFVQEESKATKLLLDIWSSR